MCLTESLVIVKKQVRAFLFLGTRFASAVRISSKRDGSFDRVEGSIARSFSMGKPAGTGKHPANWSYPSDGQPALCEIRSENRRLSKMWILGGSNLAWLTKYSADANDSVPLPKIQASVFSIFRCALNRGWTIVSTNEAIIQSWKKQSSKRGSSGYFTGENCRVWRHSDRFRQSLKTAQQIMAENWRYHNILGAPGNIEPS